MRRTQKLAAKKSLLHGRRQIVEPERRAAVRFSCFAMALGEYAAGETTHFFEARILDLSVKGVGLRVRQKIEKGVKVALTLEHAIGIFQCARSAKVIHSRRDGDFWIIGCEFSVRLTPQELRRFHVATPLRWNQK